MRYLYQVWRSQPAGHRRQLRAAGQHAKADHHHWRHQCVPQQGAQEPPHHSPNWSGLPAARERSNSCEGWQDWPCLCSGSRVSAVQPPPHSAFSLLQRPRLSLCELQHQGMNVICCLQIHQLMRISSSRPVSLLDRSRVQTQEQILLSENALLWLEDKCHPEFDKICVIWKVNISLSPSKPLVSGNKHGKYCTSLVG